MAQDVVINGTTYPAVESVALRDGNGEVIQFYPDAVRYVEQSLTPEQQEQARQNIGIDEAFKAGIVAAVIESLGGNPVFGYVDENNNIIVNGNLADGTYTVKYEMADGSTVEIGDLVIDNNVYYSVTNKLTNCTNSNSAVEVVQGESYSATITAESGYELSSVVVTMGGNAVTVTNGVINIANVTGDIVITAVAEEVQTGPTNFADPTSADWRTGYRSTTDISQYSTLTGGVTTNIISVNNGDVVEVTGINFSDTNSRTAYDFGGDYKGCLKSTAVKTSSSFANVTYGANNMTCTINAPQTDNMRIRFSGLATGTSADVVIKIKRNGTYL